MKIKKLIIIFLLSSCAHQKDLPPEKLEDCDKLILEHLNNYDYKEVIKALPSYDPAHPTIKYLGRYCSINKKIKVDELELTRKLEEVEEESRHCRYSLDNPVAYHCKLGSGATDPSCQTDENAIDEEYSSNVPSEKNILASLKKLKKDCGITSELHGNLQILKKIITIDFNFITSENEKRADEKIRYYQDILDAKLLSANQEKLKIEEAEKEEKKKQDEYYNSEEYYYSRLCNLVQTKKIYEAKITREKKVSKISGFINKNELYSYGHGIVGIDDMMSENAKSYKLKHNKNLDMSKCICDYKNANLGVVTCKVK